MNKYLNELIGHATEISVAGSAFDDAASAACQAAFRERAVDPHEIRKILLQVRGKAEKLIRDCDGRLGSVADIIAEQEGRKSE